MSLHSITEPAGTLLTGWMLVPHDDVKGDEASSKAVPSPADLDHDDEPPQAASKWERRKVS